MAITDDEEKALRAELAAKAKELKELQDAQKQVKSTDTEEARAKALKTESPDNAKLDPDVVKEVAALKTEMAEIKKRLGTGKSAGSFDLINFFGEK